MMEHQLAATTRRKGPETDVEREGDTSNSGEGITHSIQPGVAYFEFGSGLFPMLVQFRFCFQHGSFPGRGKRVQNQDPDTRA